MENWTTYLLESSCCMLGFYLLYFLLLRKETWFGLNRIYLVLTPCIAILIPLLYFSYDVPVAMDVADVITAELTDSSEGTVLGFIDGTTAGQEVVGMSYRTMLIFFYILGVVISSLIFLFKSWSLFKIYRSNEKVRKDGVTIVRCQQSLPVFSFLGCIFLNEDDYATYSPDEQIQIYQHEFAHVTGLHSLDVILMELFKIIFWFHPVVYAYQWSLQQVHEFIADRAVIAKELNPVEYATFLVQQAKSLPVGYRFGNQLFRKPINNRLIMMNTSKSRRQNAIRMFSIIPLIAVMVYSFGVEYKLVPLAPDGEMDNMAIAKDSFPERAKCYAKCTKPDIYKEVTQVLPVFTGKNATNVKLKEQKVIVHKETQKWVKKKITDYDPAKDGTDSLVWCLVEFPEVSKIVNIVMDTTGVTEFEFQEFTLSKGFDGGGESEFALIVCEDDRTPALMKEIQERLSHLGYFTSVTGKYDESTKASLLKFQKDMSISSGDLTQETLRYLKISQD